MPVIGTPVPTPASISAGPLNMAEPVVTELFGLPSYGKMRATSARQAQYTTLRLQLINNTTFVPVDMTSYGYLTGIGPQGPQGSPGSAWLKFRFMEAVGLEGYAADATVQSIENASLGIVSCTVPDEITANSGVYLCEAGLFDSSNRFLFSNTVYLFVERGLFTTSGTTNPSLSGVVGAPTSQEIRIALRDNPNLNRLIDEFEFDIAEICDAIVRTTLYFNSAPPIAGQLFDTRTFPWRYQWMDGIAAHLYEYAATYYRRNALKHQTGGVNVDDLNKEREYLQAWKLRQDKWTSWVQMKKVETNMSEGFGTLHSPYASTGRYSLGW